MPLFTQVYKSTRQNNAGDNPVMDWHPIQERVKMLLVTSCWRNWDKLQQYGHLVWGFTLKYIYTSYVVNKTTDPCFYLCSIKLLCTWRGFQNKPATTKVLPDTWLHVASYSGNRNQLITIAFNTSQLPSLPVANAYFKALWNACLGSLESTQKAVTLSNSYASFVL